MKTLGNAASPSSLPPREQPAPVDGDVLRRPGPGIRGLEALARTLGAVDAALAWNAPLVDVQGVFGADLGTMIDALVEAVRRRDRPIS